MKKTVRLLSFTIFFLNDFYLFDFVFIAILLKRKSHLQLFMLEYFILLQSCIQRQKTIIR
jgi:hypothetical protein